MKSVRGQDDVSSGQTGSFIIIGNKGLQKAAFVQHPLLMSFSLCEINNNLSPIFHFNGPIKQQTKFIEQKTQQINQPNQGVKPTANQKGVGNNLRAQ
jgi:hypothetical protein